MKIYINPTFRRRVLEVTRDKNSGVLIDIPEEKLREFKEVSEKFNKLNSEIDMIINKVAPSKYNKLVYGC